MVTRRLVHGLLSALVILTVSCTVLTGFRLVFLALGDTWAARISGGFALASLVLLLVDVLLLVGALGVAVSQLLPESVAARELGSSFPAPSDPASTDPVCDHRQDEHPPSRDPTGQHEHGDSIPM